MISDRFLADTHILLWSINDDHRLSARHRSLLNSDAVIFASVASIWEISIKRALGKLRAPENLRIVLPDADFPLLNIQPEHAETVATLPHHHRDPFDRLLIAQAQIENLTLLSADPHFALYEVDLV